MAYAKKGNFDKAIEEYTEAIRLHPKFAQAYCNRGAAYADKGNIDKAIEDFTEFIRLDPKFAPAYCNRGMAYAKKGNFDKAIEDSTEAIRLDPKFAQAYNTRGWAYEQKKHSYKALSDYTEAIRLDPKVAPASENMTKLTNKIRTTWSSPTVKLIAINIDEELKQVVVKKGPRIRLARDTEKTVEDTVKVKHSVTISDTWKAEAELKGKVSVWIVEIGSSIKAGFEKSTSRTYGVETERKRSVTLKGNGSSIGARVVWVDYYRTGRAKVMIDNEEVVLLFEFKEDFDLLTEEVD